MYSSRIFRNDSVRVNADPFHLGQGALKPEAIAQAEDIGGRIEALEREAYEKGFKAGEKAGFEFGRQKAEVLFSGLEGVLRELSGFKAALFGACEREMASLALAIARKVVQREIDAREDGVLECVRTAMKSVVAAGEITVKVNPKELGVISQYRAELARYSSSVGTVNVEPDDTVERGGCVIITNYGEVDATISSVMHEIEEALRNAYGVD